MPTITNRSPAAPKGYHRSRINLSKQLRCLNLGPMTQETFQVEIAKRAQALPESVRCIEFHSRDKATIQLQDGTMRQFRYERIQPAKSKVLKLSGNFLTIPFDSI
jgi:hypothetical protein